MAWKYRLGRHRWAAAGLMALALAGGIARSASGVLVDMAGHWSAPLVAALEARGIIAGDPSGRFQPDAPLARAEMAKLLVVGLGNEKDAELLQQYPSRFTDIPGWHWARGYVESLAESAVTDGYPDGTFGPSDPVTRAQMAVFLVRAAGMAEQARLMRFESTPYRDNGEIPDWARGAVQVALASGLMSGFGDLTFRPLQPITRAEGSVTLLRLLELKGAAYHMAGTLVRFDPVTRQGTVRDPVGQEQPFTMARAAQYFRGGVPVSPQKVSPPDQVWIVLGPDGTGRFMDARYMDLQGTRATVADQSLTVTLSDGRQRTFTVQSGALVFYNGRVAPLSQVNGAPEVYLALDQVTSEVRVIDAVNAPIQGEVADLDAEHASLVVNVGDEQRALTVSPDAVLLLNSLKVSLVQIQPGDRVRLALDSADDIVYLQADR
jgi:hypothetical protein